MRGPRIRRMALIVATIAVLGAAGFTAAGVLAAAPLHSLCSAGYVNAVIGGKAKCLKAGEFCSPQSETDYERYGFSCVNGRLEGGSSTTMTFTDTTTTAGPPSVGSTVLMRPRTRTHGCRLGALPDRRCSPGARYSRLTKSVICSSSFRMGTIRDVPESEKHAVEVEYGMTPRSYGHTLEIDHIVSLELGGSNSIANLYPEEAHFRSGSPGYHVKDRLENRLHDMVCAGEISLPSAQRQIAGNWEKLYLRVFHRNP